MLVLIFFIIKDVKILKLSKIIYVELNSEINVWEGKCYGVKQIDI